MKESVQFLLRSLPLAAGLVCCLTALSFLVSFTDSARFSNMGEEDFVAFVVLALVGIPVLLLGVRKLAAPAP